MSSPLTVKLSFGWFLLLCACSAFDLEACTLIGCDSGLTIVVEGLGGRTARVEAAAPGSPPRVFECAAGTECRVFLAGFQPREVTVRVVTGDQTAVETAQLVYTARRPNGPDCPACEQGEVRIVVAS